MLYFEIQIYHAHENKSNSVFLVIITQSKVRFSWPRSTIHEEDALLKIPYVCHRI